MKYLINYIFCYLFRREKLPSFSNHHHGLRLLNSYRQDGPFSPLHQRTRPLVVYKAHDLVIQSSMCRQLPVPKANTFSLPTRSDLCPSDSFPLCIQLKFVEVDRNQALPVGCVARHLLQLRSFSIAYLAQILRRILGLIYHMLFECEKVHEVEFFFIPFSVLL